ncbi:hypothetical protein PGT21_032171 [Puccinia graminis f. sp. tritici]|uniref:Uncharacterized protein n=1 Tax=Puccinia graminis f. sp. tritici TaxID=56615 RepID=A0A5B0PV82_PUCGR|nr:hypothetical protein PGTUg99_012920 [Puccinia graminis f. sp. tritici]KAA1104813.1 hypothetical protein PGT21_032171 [Puccinia graminis f. sp. tritici]
MVSLENNNKSRLQFPSIKLLVIVLTALCGPSLPLSSAPTPVVSDFNTPMDLPVEAFFSRTKTPNDEPCRLPTGKTPKLKSNKSNHSPSKEPGEALSQSGGDFGMKYSTTELPELPNLHSSPQPRPNPRPQSVRVPDVIKPPAQAPNLPSAKPRNRDKVKDAIRNNWSYYFKKLSRKLLSMITTNAAAGNRWKIINVDFIANITSIDMPNNLTSPAAIFQGIMNSPGEGGGDMTRLLDQIVSLAPIGPLVHRTEVDLDFNLEQVVQLYFISPRESTTRLSSVGPGAIPRVTASSDQNGNPRSLKGTTDPLKDYLVDRAPTKAKSRIRESLKGQSAEFQSSHSPEIFKEAFSFWLSATLHQIHPFENKSWLSLCPSKLGQQNSRILTPCVVIFTSTKKDHIQSIITYDLPFL